MAASRLLRTLILLALVELLGAVDPPVLVPPGSAVGADDGDARLRQLATNMGEADDRCKAVAVSGLNGQSCESTDLDRAQIAPPCATRVAMRVGTKPAITHYFVYDPGNLGMGV